MDARSHEPAGYQLKRLRSKAQSKALTTLTNLYRGRYEALYREYRASGKGPSAAQSRARMRMSLEYPDDFRDLYDKELGDIRGS